MMEESECKILGSFGIFIQIMLGLLSLSVLLLKRKLETPKRALVVWGLDTSKQVFSAFLAHLINMTLAVILAQNNDNDDCEWYFTNLATEIGLGILLCYMMLKTIEHIAANNGLEVLNTGVYIHDDYSSFENAHLEPTDQGKNTVIDYRIWMIQLIVWGNIVIVVSLIALFLFVLYRLRCFCISSSCGLLIH